MTIAELLFKDELTEEQVKQLSQTPNAYSLYLSKTKTSVQKSERHLSYARLVIWVVLWPFLGIKSESAIILMFLLLVYEFVYQGSVLEKNELKQREWSMKAAFFLACQRLPTQDKAQLEAEMKAVIEQE